MMRLMYFATATSAVMMANDGVLRYTQEQLTHSDSCNTEGSGLGGKGDGKGYKGRYHESV